MQAEEMVFKPPYLLYCIDGPPEFAIPERSRNGVPAAWIRIRSFSSAVFCEGAICLLRRYFQN
jgi:hypothetical protein